MSQRRDPPKEAFSTIKNKFNQAGDYNLALSLQEQEFSQHYDNNRKNRRTSVEDHNVSREEQAKEKQTALTMHLSEMTKIIQEDELLAMELQKQFEEEYRQHREQIINADAELAQRLAVELGEKGPELDVDQLDLPSTSQTVARSNRGDESERCVREPGESGGSRLGSNNSIATTQASSHQITSSWSSTNPFLQDLLGDLAENNIAYREHSTGK